MHKKRSFATKTSLLREFSFVFVWINLFPVEKEQEESSRKRGDKDGKEAPLVELLLCPQLSMVPVPHMLLVVPGTLVACCHHRVHLAGPRACPWASLDVLGVDLVALSRIQEAGGHWLERLTDLQAGDKWTWQLVSCCSSLPHALELLRAGGRLHTRAQRSLAFCCLINMTRVAAAGEPFVVVTIRKAGDLFKRQTKLSYSCAAVHRKHQIRLPLGAHREPVWHQCHPGPAWSQA